MAEYLSDADLAAMGALIDDDAPSPLAERVRYYDGSKDARPALNARRAAAWAE